MTNFSTPMKILLDPGHGRNTPGKCSPDGSFREYQYTREIVAAVAARLHSLGHDADILVPEFEDIPLKERVKRVNKICNHLGKGNVILVSVHVDAAGSDGQWHNASGWSCYTSPGQTLGDELASCLYRAAEIHLLGHKLRTDYSDGDPDKEAGFYILRKTKCPAALVECGFMDNRESLQFIVSPEGRKANISVIVDGILKFLCSSTD